MAKTASFVIVNLPTYTKKKTRKAKMFMNIIVIIVTICEGVNMFEFSVLNALPNL